MKIVNAILSLRRDNEYNFNRIKDTFVPQKGEVVLVDTSNGLRAKIGNGISNYGQLPFIEAEARNSVINGFYDEGKFYENASKTTELAASIGKIYIDNSHSKIYFYDGEQYIQIQQALSTASTEKEGLVKLYNTLGNNIDGTITQKKITEEFESRYKTSVNLNDEELIFSL